MRAAISKGGSARPAAQNYWPSDKEPFISERQQEYFRAKLLAWKEDILKEVKETLQRLQAEDQNLPDMADRRRRKPSAPLNCVLVTVSAS